MKVLFICYPKCTTCQKAEKWLNDNGIDFEKRDISLDNPKKEELQKWIPLSGEKTRKFFNTSGLIYKNERIKEKLDNMGDEDMIDMLSERGMLVKRPIVIAGNKVLVGFKEEKWKEAFLK